MKIKIIAIGKTEEKYIEEGMAVYFNRIQKYLPVTLETPQIKAAKHTEQKRSEADTILNKLKREDYLILLDEKGKATSSIEFSSLIQNLQNQSKKQLVFLIGGAYGFDESIYQRADYKLSLSKMTFPHQLVRLIFMEQLYRAFSILHREPYHHS